MKSGIKRLFEIPFSRVSGWKKVARRATSGINQIVEYRALKMRAESLARLQRAYIFCHIPDVARLATFSLRLRR